ncbi:MAG: helix-turn-helix domain-containing protein [Croceivirga sp.]
MTFAHLDFAHNPFLNRFVDIIYCIHNVKNELEYKTIPNGFIGLSIISSGKAHIKMNLEWEKVPKLSIFGMGEKPYEIKISNDYKEISIGFKPYHFNLFINHDLAEFTKGKVIDAIDVFEPSSLEHLYDQITANPSEHHVIENLSIFFKAHFLSKKENQLVLFATKLIYENETNKVEELARKLNVSAVTVRNLFNQHIGVTPKELIKITRTHKALQYQKQHLQTLTELGLSLGYFDQSHFIREFKSIIGVSPKEYFKNKKLAFDFYNYGRWLSDNFA